MSAAMLAQRPIVSPVARPPLTRDSFNAQAFGRSTNRLIKEVCGLATRCLRQHTSSGPLSLLTLSCPVTSIIITASLRETFD